MMADQPPSIANPFIAPSTPSLMEDAMASLRFDSSADHAAILYHAQAQIAQPAPESQAPIPPRMQQIARHHSNQNNAAVNLDPVPGDPDTVFIRAPFTEFPGSADRKAGLSYNDMAANPNWFLDVNDFVGPNAVGYPTQLEPPRGWLPNKKKDGKETWESGKEPRLRCTLCRRNYAGVNAKSMWRRHVYEKHKIAMANRRDNNDRPGGRGRGSNKENKAGPSEPAKPAEKEQPSRSTGKSLRRVVSLEVQASSSNVEAGASPQTQSGDAQVEDAAHGQSSGDEEQSFIEHPSFSSTPPQTPGFSDSLAPAFEIAGPPPESPYNPLMTPMFRHSPAQLGAKQIWKFSPKVTNKIRDYTLAMLARGESSPNVRGLDVSPLVLVPASERQKRSIFSPPRKSSSALSVSPRRLFAEAGEEDSIQSRLDQPGWDNPSTPGFLLPSPGRMLDLEDSLFDFYAHESQFAISTPLRSGSESRMEDSKAEYFALAASQQGPLSPPPTIADTPHTKMFINGFISPLKGPDSSPIPNASAGLSTSTRGGSASPSPSPKMTSIPFTPLLPPFTGKGLSPMPSGSGRSFDEARMDIDESADSPAFASKSLPSWQDLFNPGSSSRSQLDSDGSTPASTSLSGAFGSISSLSVAGGGRPTVTPSHSNDRNRGRSVSNAGASSSLSASTSSSGGQKSSIGLMDAVLDKKSRRRKHSHSEHRGDGDVGVTAMGSPFKMGRKTSRSEFLYSLDGDCEMQDVQPKKRRKTISGRD